MFKNTFRRLARISPKQLVVASAFVVALAGAVSLGHATKQTTHAADCTGNAIIKCGTPNRTDFIEKVRTNYMGDTQAIYNKFGLQSVDYTRFANEAVPGMANMDGTITVNGRVVATDAWSIGRDKKAHSWNWNGYWADYATQVNRSNIPVMVLFDENGAMEFAVMNECGNPTTGKIITPTFDCKALNKSPVAGEKDTYNFSVDAPVSNGATVAKVVYNFGDGTSATMTNLNPVKHKFTKPGNFTVTASVTFNLPNGKQKTVEAVKCRTQITVVAPYYACVQLYARALNDKKTQFRFTVKTSQGNGATLKDVDFTLDGKNTVTGVTDKDAEGNIYRDYSFNDSVEHTVVAKVNFNVADGVQSKTCEAKVTPEKAPECPSKPGSGLPPESPECQEYCKPGIPVGDARCEETPPAELPKTGMGSVLGLFAGTSAAGAVAHRVVTSRRKRA